MGCEAWSMRGYRVEDDVGTLLEGTDAVLVAIEAMLHDVR